MSSQSPTNLQRGTVAPEGVVTAELGAIYIFQSSTTEAIAYQKASQAVAGVPDSAGWVDLSLPVGYANMHFHDPGTPTAIAAPATFVKAENVSHLHVASANITMPVDNRLLYTGPRSVVALCLASLSFFCASNNQTLAFAIAVDGAINVASIVRSRVTTGADIRAVSLMTQLVLNSGSYIEIWVANDTSAGDITIDHGNTVLRA